MDESGLGFTEFEAMLGYPEDQSTRMLRAVETKLERPLMKLEDVGTFLVSNPQVEALRRLLRFGGVNYVDFLHSSMIFPTVRASRFLICICRGWN